MFEVLALALLLALCSAEDRLIVRTRSGTVRGITVDSVEGKSVDAFLGIPYGASTGGQNRFSPPKEAEPWSGVFDADRFSSPCYQVVGDEVRNDPSVSSDEESEECLSVNIWIPKPRPWNGPVMVWIHGGAFAAGSSSLPQFNGATLAASEDIIVVTLNYRLSVFGFLYLDHPSAPGNVALMDQALALKWLQQNIHAFGGDPEQVTIFGESAGSASVSFHLFLPSSEDLFQKAVLQSGSANSMWATSDTDYALKLGLLFLTRAGCPVEESRRAEAIRCLLNLSPKKLVEAALTIEERPMTMTFKPVVDGKYLPAAPAELLDKGKYRGEKQVLMGYTREDGSVFIPLLAPQLTRFNKSAYTEGELRELISVLTRSHEQISGFPVDLVTYIYKDWESSSLTFDGVLQFVTDRFFGCPCVIAADKMAAKGNKIFVYRFDHEKDKEQSPRQLPPWMGSAHGDDIPFVFGTHLKGGANAKPGDIKLSKQMMRYWSNFAKKGNPNDDYLPNWPSYTPESKLRILLDSGELTLDKVKSHRECYFWADIFDEVYYKYKN